MLKSLNGGTGMEGLGETVFSLGNHNNNCYYRFYRHHARTFVICKTTGYFCIIKIYRVNLVTVFSNSLAKILHNSLGKGLSLPAPFNSKTFKIQPPYHHGRTPFTLRFTYFYSPGSGFMVQRGLQAILKN